MKPEAVGLSASRLARLDEVMQRRYVDSGRLPGVLTIVYRRGKLAHTGMSGHMDLKRDKRMREDAIFRIYSMSKPITSVALMMLVEEGLIGLDDDVATHIPSWKNLGVYATGLPGLVAVGEPSFVTTPVVRPMKVVDLVTHTSGLTYGFINRTSVDRAYRRAHITPHGQAAPFGAISYANCSRCFMLCGAAAPTSPGTRIALSQNVSKVMP